MAAEPAPGFEQGAAGHCDCTCRARGGSSPLAARPLRIDVAVLALVGNSVLPNVGGGIRTARARLGRDRFGLALTG